MDKDNGTYILAVVIIVAGLLIGLGAYLGGKGNNESSDKNDNNEQQINFINLKPISEDDHLFGNPNADVVIVEYSDTECPFCKRFHKTMNTIMEKDEYGKNGRVAWVYRHFPLDSLHSKARNEAYATECAAELGGNTGFWNYINRLYEITPANNGLDLDKLPEIAGEISLDVEKFKECLDRDNYIDKIQESVEDALVAGGQGTPFNVVVTKNGDTYVVGGALPEQMMTAALDVILNSIDNNISYKETSLQLQKVLR